MANQAVAKPLPTDWTTQPQNKHTPTSMLRVEIEQTTPVFEHTKTVYDLYCAATVIGTIN
jgi:hypothetical protein